ncbi:MAG: hypothetical protein ACOC44_15805, partial [Promethearchaeia archaeon]
MGRFFITNDPELYSAAKKVNKKAGLEISGEISNNSIYLGVYKKRAIDNINFIKPNSKDFIASTGTLFYRGKIGSNALKEIYQDYDSRIEKIRDKCIGHYSLIIKKDNIIKICSDQEGAYEIYYHEFEQKWFISSSLLLNALMIKDPTVETLRLIERIIQLTNMGEKTFIKNVNQLFWNQLIKVDLEDKKLKLETKRPERIGKKYENENIEQIVEDLKIKMQNISHTAYSIFGQDIGLQLTGGLDSRSILAALLNAGSRPLILYGQGNSGITNTKKNDVIIAKLISKKYDLHFYKMDWSGKYLEHNKATWDRYFEKYGFRYTIYGSTPNFFKEYEGKIKNYPSLIVAGYGT